MREGERKRGSVAIVAQVGCREQRPNNITDPLGFARSRIQRRKFHAMLRGGVRFINAYLEVGTGSSEPLAARAGPTLPGGARILPPVGLNLADKTSNCAGVSWPFSWQRGRAWYPPCYVDVGRLLRVFRNNDGPTLTGAATRAARCRGTTYFLSTSLGMWL